jgi:hypothetical protein
MVHLLYDPGVKLACSNNGKKNPNRLHTNE